MPVVQVDVTGIKNTTLDDGNNDDQKIKFDGYTSITFSGTNFLYSFSFLRNWNMQFYSATCFRMASFAFHSFLTPKGHALYDKIYIKCYFA